MPAEEVMLDRATHKRDRSARKPVEWTPANLVTVCDGMRLTDPTRTGEIEVDALASGRGVVDDAKEAQIGWVERDSDLFATLSRCRGGRGLATVKVSPDGTIFAVLEPSSIPAREKDRSIAQQEDVSDDWHCESGQCDELLWSTHGETIAHRAGRLMAWRDATGEQARWQKVVHDGSPG